MLSDGVQRRWRRVFHRQDEAPPPVRWTGSRRSTSSAVSGNTVYIQAGDKATQTGDINLAGSNINSQGLTTLLAGHDLSRPPVQCPLSKCRDRTFEMKPCRPSA
ncbi:hypothetical protein DBR42_14000 [Pelomonas sp. HMWF004]|nr:hypothetical protein DBR42_14000 [Pelomonas sp. HMWF004]